MNTYDSEFYAYINKGSTNSASLIIPLVLNNFSIQSVIDFGCGQGAWLQEWKRLGVKEILGLDGSYVNKHDLLIEAQEFKAWNLNQPAYVGKKFDLVQCLEVAEHIPEKRAEKLIECLVQHGDIILFSAAPPGQGGHDHINEKPYEFWRDKFLKHNYVLIDSIRPHINKNSAIERWYRYNIFYFVNQDIYQDLPKVLQTHRIENTDSIPDVSPLLYKQRKRLIKLLPPNLHLTLAKVKKHSILLARRLGFTK